jgi:beta-galactosidase/beta-glucuronidase
MPVPSSYNDITEDPSLRDHVGVVWYDRRFFVPRSWGKNQKVWIRFGSVHYEAVVVSFKQEPLIAYCFTDFLFWYSGSTE